MAHERGNGNKYFRGYEICATGIRNFVARVGIPFYSFDACFSKHLYYIGVYGNMMDKDKKFDDKVLDEDYISRSDAYKMLSLQSTKKYKANITRQFHKSRSAKRTHVVCVTDKDAPSLAHCKCSYRAVIK